jgi:hypothetical protein
MKKKTKVLKEKLMKLRHDDEMEFVRLVASMVGVLESPEFRDVAARFNAWPVNVPALATRGTRKISNGPPKRTWMISRERKCHRVLDELLQVGSGLALNLSPAKHPKLDDPMVGLAYEIALIMSGVRERHTDANEIHAMLNLGSSKRGIRLLQEWCDSVLSLSRSDARSKWVQLGFCFAQLRYRRDLEMFVGIKSWVNSLKGDSVVIHTKTRKGLEGFLKSRFAQAMKPLIKKLGQENSKEDS